MIVFWVMTLCVHLLVGANISEEYAASDFTVEMRMDVYVDLGEGLNQTQDQDVIWSFRGD